MRNFNPHEQDTATQLKMAEARLLSQIFDDLRTGQPTPMRPTPLSVVMANGIESSKTLGGPPLKDFS